MTYVLAVDPGKATGMALFSFEKGIEPEILWSRELQFEEYAASIREAYALAGPELYVVCERFTINAQTVKNSQAPYSLECIGALKQVMLDNGVPVSSLILQSPADAKAMWDNAKLKKVGLWHKGGEGHALDAIRHGALYMIKLGWNPLDKLRS